MSPSLRRRSTWRAVLPAALLVAACGGGRDETIDDTLAVGTATTPATDSGMRGAAAASRGAPRDSNQAYLRMMSDHHQGLIALVDTARPKLGAAAKADAEKVATAQKNEQQHMIQMLRGEYAETITPAILPSNQAMIQAVAGAAAGETDRVFYQQVIAHHREGIEMAGKMLPHLTGMSKDMAEKARTDQQREIADFEKKAAGGSR